MNIGKFLLFFGLFLGIIANIIRIKSNFTSGDSFLVIAIIIGIVGIAMMIIQKLKIKKTS